MIDDPLAVYVILNGSLGMSRGKLASQSFHAGRQAQHSFQDAMMHDWVSGHGWCEWGQREGFRVNVRLADTPHVFARVMEECQGRAIVDEGLTEVEPGSTTAFVTVPYRFSEIPKILSHKRVQLL